MLEVSDLTVRYGPATALSSASLKVDRGEIVAVIGRNGSGKTTLLRAITGLVRPAAGRVIFEGRHLAGQPADAIVKMGISHVPQGRQIFGDQTVEDNLILGAFSRLPAGRSDLPRLLEREYQRFPRLKERRRQMAGTLSGGEQQMLAISRALMSDPRFIVMDEPSMGLAPLFVKQVLDTVVALRNDGCTILLVEQLARAALGIADRAYVLQTGEVKLSGGGRELLAQDALMKSYLGE